MDIETIDGQGNARDSIDYFLTQARALAATDGSETLCYLIAMALQELDDLRVAEFQARKKKARTQRPHGIGVRRSS